MPKLTINDIEIEVPQGTSILQACEAVGEEIPRFCYHDRLSVPANCRMCLVEVEKSPKPVASCAMACGEGMIVKTNTEMVHKARKGVMEMLLINHPLDCPICDQGGECDLQDQAVAYGFDRSRYEESKRAVRDKDFGPLIATSMNRCINCTRCIRCAEEVGGIYDLGQLNRGEDAEISTFIGSAIASELSGNLVDVCPVGALTSKPYQFKARPWELRKTNSIDVMDAVGSAIRVDARGDEVMRVLPRLNEAVNEEWISDKTRHACDGLSKNRLDRPYVRKNGKLVAVEWEEALSVAGAALNQGPVGAIVGDLVDMDSTFALKQLMDGLGATNYECRQYAEDLPMDMPHLWRMNTPIADLEKCDALLLIGCNPRLEAAMVNARLTKAYQLNGMKAYRVGPARELTYPVEDMQTLESGFAKLKDAKFPVVIVGLTAVGALGDIVKLAESHNVVRGDWNGFNVLQRAAGRMGALHLGFSKGTKDEFDKVKTLYLHGADDSLAPKIPSNMFVIYQGHHGGALASRADVILPGAAYTEKTALYMNCEGRVQQAFMAVHPPGLAKEDWKIIRALADKAGVLLHFDTHHELRAKMPQFALDQIVPAEWKGHKGASALPAAFTDANLNFYETCAISRNSPTMRACTERFVTGARKAAA